MFIDAWGMRLAKSSLIVKELRKEIKTIEKQVDQLLDRIVDSGNTTIITAYEKRVNKLERQKIAHEEKTARTGKTKHSLEESLERSMQFPPSPSKYTIITPKHGRKPCLDWHFQRKFHTAGYTDFEH